MKNETKFQQMLAENLLTIFYRSGKEKAEILRKKCYYAIRIDVTLYRFDFGIEYFHLNYIDMQSGVRQYFKRCIHIKIPFVSLVLNKHIAETTFFK